MTPTGELARLLQLMLDANQLKRIPRSGWLQRGIGPSDTESVAEHTYGTALAALLLVDMIDEEVNLGRLLVICLLHDLAETHLLDLPPTATRHLAPTVKRRAEQSALRLLLSGVHSAQELEELWLEFEDASSVEGRLARDADKLEMMIQAASYERAGWRGLEEYWAMIAEHQWFFPVCRDLLDEIRSRRPPVIETRGAEDEQQ